MSYHPKIKLCGLRRPEDIALANTCKPDYIGFVLAPSKRRIDFATARALSEDLDPAIKAVGVFVNEDPETVAEYYHRGIIDLIQLHGDEDEGYLRRLKARTFAPIIKAVRVGGSLPPLPQCADHLLFDALNPAARGGTGQPFDWSLVKATDVPFFLAGGITAENVALAVETCSPYCVDVSSGVETNGYKDREKVTRFVEAVRRLK